MAHEESLIANELVDVPVEAPFPQPVPVPAPVPIIEQQDLDDSDYETQSESESDSGSDLDDKQRKNEPVESVLLKDTEVEFNGKVHLGYEECSIC